MIDHLVGRPSPSWKRIQVFLVIAFWSWHATRTREPPTRWLSNLNQKLRRFTPWQIVVSTLTGVYLVRNLDKILGLGSPEPLAKLYSRSYYRVTWINTALDAGFATAMGIKPQWFKDLCSVVFTVYYLVYANEADEKLRRFRAVCTLEMLRATWEKTTNPYIAAFTSLRVPAISIKRKVVLPRPGLSVYKRPITAWLFFAPPESELDMATELILDFPGGGFVAMSPLHHEERLRMWAKRTGKPIFAVDYGKAPEHPYPFAIEEGFDVYRLLCESGGSLIGMAKKKLRIIITGDSAGANIAVNVMTKLLEAQTPLPRPLALVLNYAALDFNFTSWMSPTNLAVLRTEQSSGAVDRLVMPEEGLAKGRSMSSVGGIDRRGGSKRRTRTLTVGQMDSYGARDFTERNRPVSSHAHLQHASVQDSKTPQEPVGTRMTMTSRTGYFQDRIISPSMMRAMAIMYIGPRRNPDFEHDYYISPILTPAYLLAQFPPLLMQCGEKDPFVDDTVIFAGRVREAKRARKAELLRILSRETGGVGESLRMSSATPERRDDLEAEYDRLSQQDENEWVDMQLFAEWSHGYLQMPSLMHEAALAIDDLADWILEAFDTSRTALSDRASGSSHMHALTMASNGKSEQVGPARHLDGPQGAADRSVVRSPSSRPGAPLVLLAPTDDDDGDTARRLWGSREKTEGSGVCGGTAGEPRLNSATGDPERRSSVALMEDISGGGGADRNPGSPPGTSSGNGIGGARVPGSKPGQAATAGLVISEGELMRRRRLLDSHIFDN